MEASTPSGAAAAAAAAEPGVTSTTPTTAPRTSATTHHDGRDGGTPLHRALGAEPSSHLRLSAPLRTPGGGGGGGNVNFRASQQRLGHLSASGRRGTAVFASTPHGRQALAAREARRALFNTPGLGRRRSIRDQRDTPRNVLRALASRLAPTSRPLTSSSSSPAPGDGSAPRGARRGTRGGSLPALPEGDSDDDIPIDRPRLSLPIDEDDDDESDLLPPRSSGLEEDNFTVQSLELPRRALSEQPADRYSIRMSDFYAAARQDEEDPFRGGDDTAVGLESGLFPPMQFDDAEGPGAGDVTYDRIIDSEAERRATLAGRPSDFGTLEVPMEGNESTVLLAPQVQDSPSRAEEAWSSDHGGPADHDDDDDDGGGDGDDGGDGASEPEVLGAAAPSAEEEPRRAGKKAGKKRSRYGIEYPSLPAGVVKRLAQTFAQTSGVRKPKIGPDTLAAIQQASEWFFEQLGDDLRAYADHAKRRTIDESDVTTLMRRQRQTSSSTTPFSLAQRHLPRELLQELRMPPPVVARQKRRAGGAGRGEDGEEEVT